MTQELQNNGRTNTHATIEDLSEAVFSVRSMPRPYSHHQLPLPESFKAPIRRVEIPVRWSSAREDVSPEAEERPLLGDVNKQSNEDRE
jgi:hypothetical protein